MNSQSKQLRNIYITAVLFFVTVIIVITWYSLWRLREETAAGLLEVSAMHTRSFEGFLTQNFRLAELTTTNIANMDSRKKNYFNIERSLLATLKNNPAQRSISLLDENGKIIVSSNRANVGITINMDTFLPKPTGEQDILRIGMPWIGRDFISGSPTTHQNPVRAEKLNFVPVIHTLSFGTRSVTLLIALNTDFFINHISQILNNENGIVDIIRYDGTLLMTTDISAKIGALSQEDQYNLSPEAIETGQFLAQLSEASKPSFSSFRASQLYSFLVVTRIDRNRAMQSWKAEAKTLLGVIVAIVLTLAGLIIVFYRRQLQIEDEREKSEQLQRINATVFGSSADSIIITDINAQIISVNPAFCKMTGYSPEDIIGKNPRMLSSGLQDSSFYQRMWKCIHEKGVWRGELTNRCKDGRLYDVQSTITAFHDGQGHLQHFIGVSTDITERKKSETKQRQAASVFTNSQEGIMITNEDNLIIDVNPSFTRITGYSYNDVIGKNPSILASGRQSPEFYSEMKSTLIETGSWQGEIWNRKKSGDIYAERLSIDTVHKENGDIGQYVAVFSDISRIKIHEAELHRIAHYDPLTSIPNRRLLGDRLVQTIAKSKRNNRSLAVCYLDLDGFKPVNDQYGHASGDLLLIEVTQRLLKILRDEDTLARLGGDEFVILFAEIEKAEEVDIALRRVLKVINEPIAVENNSVSISASIGVTIFPEDSADADTLLRHADQAMYRAKDAGKNRYHLFDPELDLEVQARRSQLKSIEKALKNHEFVLYYQPKVNLVSGEVIGAEALIRWRHPVQGILPPAAFLDLIDGHDLEIEIGEWVIESVVKQILIWNKAGLFFPVSANLSANHLLKEGFSSRLKGMLARYPEVKHEDLELEILETSTLNDLDQANSVLATCRNMGVRFALDDFGTGYSSLTYFQRLPVDILKIDQSFVRDMLDDPNDLDIVESIIRLAQTFNRPVIAEGVETLEHGAMLIQLGCQQAQGYGIARPMPAEKIPDWVTQWQTTRPWASINQPLKNDNNLSLKVAMQSHINWLDSLESFMKDPACPHPRKIHNHGQFRRWFYSSGFARYGSLEEFQDIAPLYDATRSLCSELIKLVNDGHNELACKRLTEFHQQRNMLITKIEILIAKLEQD
ncbi:EAL domain-containing protein [Neptunomonas sp.]|uniref:EAL domain-containing protein n=1 Tax=Neptunomonas sp. TaxID=1971898 RepID=UPI0025F28D67|nr:EAL domain-containing protein [Neptunomonas sp.]